MLKYDIAVHDADTIFQANTIQGNIVWVRGLEMSEMRVLSCVFIARGVHFAVFPYTEDESEEESEE